MQRFWLVLVVILAAACDDDLDIGTRLSIEDSFQVFSIDTLTLKPATVQYDSLYTQGDDRLLLGYHEDEYLGNLYSASFFEYSPDESYDLRDEDDKVTFDSVTIYLEYDDYSYYDTLDQVTYSVYPIKSEMDLDDGFYNTSNVDVDTTDLLGRVSFLAWPTRSDTVEFRIRDDFGQELFDLAKEGDEVVQSESEFLKYYFGLGILPDSTNGPMLGFSTDFQIRVYYSDRTQVPTEQYSMTFSLNNGLNYNKISYDRKHIPLGALVNSEDELLTTYTKNMGFVQGGVGLGLRVEIPYVTNLLYLDEDYVLSQAKLILRPVKKTYTDLSPLPTSLYAYYVDEDNDELTSTPNELSLYEDPYDPEEVYYSMDITAFIEYQLAITEYNNNALLFTLTDDELTDTFNRIVIGDAESDYQMELKLYYITI